MVKTTNQNTRPDQVFDVKSQFSSARLRFLESIAVVLLILVIIGPPLSLSRIYLTTLNLNHIAHLFTSIMIVTVLLFRKKRKDRRLIAYSLLMFTVLKHLRIQLIDRNKEGTDCRISYWNQITAAIS